MELFKTIASLTGNGDTVTIVVTKAKDGRLSVAVDPKPADSGSVTKIPPFLLTGTPEELDEGFTGEIGRPIEMVMGLQSNIKELESSIAAAKKSAEEAAKKSAKAAKPAAKTAPKAAAPKAEPDTDDEKADEAAQEAPEAEETEEQKAAREAEEAKKAEAEKTAKVSARWPEFMAAKREKRWQDGLDILVELEAIAVKQEQKTAISNAIAFCKAQLAQPELGI